MAHLIGVVENRTLRPELEDSRRWISSKNGVFSVKSCSHLFGHVGPPSQVWKKIWGLKIPSKISFFVWTTCKEKLPTIDFLQKRDMILTNVCCLCLQEAKSVNHIFISCPFAKEV